MHHNFTFKQYTFDLRQCSFCFFPKYFLVMFSHLYNALGADLTYPAPSLLCYYLPLWDKVGTILYMLEQSLFRWRLCTNDTNMLQWQEMMKRADEKICELGWLLLKTATILRKKYKWIYLQMLNFTQQSYNSWDRKPIGIFHPPRVRIMQSCLRYQKCQFC